MSTVKCMVCGKESRKFDAFSNLTLPLPSHTNRCTLWVGTKETSSKSYDKGRYFYRDCWASSRENDKCFCVSTGVDENFVFSGCWHDTGPSFAQKRVLFLSLLWFCICLYASSSRYLNQSRYSIPVRHRWTRTSSACTDAHITRTHVFNQHKLSLHVNDMWSQVVTV